MKYRQYGSIFHVFCLTLLLPCSINAAVQPTTSRVSVSSSGVQGNNWSHDPSISATGRYVAFESDADNLVPGDTNNTRDVFVRDRVKNITIRVSVDSNGNQGNGWTSYAPISSPSISADGRHVAFRSSASNLVAGDTNGFDDIFVHDCETGQTTMVSINSNGTGGGNSDSASPSISADGRYIAFQSWASNLVAGDSYGHSDVFVRDRQTNTTSMVSIDSNGNQGNNNSDNPSISADGRHIAFASYATSLVDADTTSNADIFVRDRGTDTTTKISIDASGNQTNNDCLKPAISADGRYVAFESSAPLVTDDSNTAFDIFVRDRRTNTTTRVSVDSNGNQGNAWSLEPSISADGRYVAFSSLANNMVADDSNGVTDIFVHDRQTAATTRVSAGTGNSQGNEESYIPAISADGHYVAFASLASNLSTNDSNGVPDVFVRGPLVGFPWEMYLPAIISNKP